ncbi:MAG TPA: carboxypeptidase regulatory-like domain-containing protein [Candidatus Angelobacter sp.]|nr:carboxypeptidase regulatory-like domain-containing protein [Candidatus Angelobacter sp.]
MVRSTLRRVAVLLFGLLLMHSSLLPAQSTYGDISGTITDQTGALVQAASIKLTNQETKHQSTTSSDGDGNFRFVNVNAGQYTIEVSAQSLSTAHQDFILLARQSARLDFRLVISTASQEIEVTAQPSLSDQLTISDSRSGDEIDSLALNFRATNNTSPIGVANLTAGVQPDRNGNISVAGGLPYFTSFSIDGVSTTNVRFNGPNKDLFPSVESIAEFKVNTANNNAEFAQPSDITVVSKSGTNALHGGVYWFHQNAALNAKDPFATVKPKLVANDFGGYVGGPVFKDKTFFFADYEGTRRPQQVVVNEILPPTPWRNGDFSSLLPAVQLKNPLNGAIIPNNNLAAAGLINPVSQKILSALFASPNNPANTNVATPNFQANVPGNFTVNGFDGRVDHIFNENHKVYARYTFKNVDTLGNNGDPNYNTQLGSFANNSQLRNLAGSYNWVISPTMVNELRGGLSFATFVTSYPLAAQGASLEQSFGFSGLPPAAKSGGVPDISIPGFIDTNAEGRPRTIENHTWDVSDTFTWLRHKHTFKFGFEYWRYSFKDFLTFTSGDEFGDYTFGALSGNSFADFLLGIPVNTDFAQNGPNTNPFSSQYSWFAQDEWKVNSRLSVNYGLRYDIRPPFDDATHQLAQFDRNFPGGRVIVQDQTGLNLVSPFFKSSIGSTPIVLAQNAGLPHTLRNTYYGDWEPRFGFSWRPTSSNKTVVRSAIGVYSVPVLGSVLYSLAGVATSNFENFTQNISGGKAALSFPNVFPNGGGQLPVCPPACQGYRRANNVNLKDPRNIEWSFSVEQDLGWQTTGRITYTGSHTTQLIYSPDLNQVQPNTVGYAALTATPALRQQNLKFPNFNEVLTRDNGPSAKYEAVAFELSRRIVKGIGFQNSYTLAYNNSNALGSAPSSLIAQGSGGENGPNTLNIFNINSDYGNVIYTRRHRFVNTLFYDLPFGRGRHFLPNANGLLNSVVGGWGVNGITLLQSGAFLTPTFIGTDPSGTNPNQRSAGNFQRPDCVAGVDPNAAGPLTGQFFNPAAFSIPGNNIGRNGTCGVGILHGPGTVTFSSTVGKQFQLSERVALRYEAAFANLFNHFNPDVPNTLVGSPAVNPAFGKVTAVQSGEEAGPRNIQMSVRIIF